MRILGANRAKEKPPEGGLSNALSWLAIAPRLARRTRRLHQWPEPQAGRIARTIQISKTAPMKPEIR